MLQDRGFRIATLGGFNIRVDPSVVIIAVLILLQLGLGLLPTWHPRWAASSVWGVSLAATLLFFVSILVHELAHAVVARLYGMRVQDLTLFIFGGMAHIEDQPPTPKSELWMAAAGPLASLGLAALAVVMVTLTGGAELIGAADPLAVIADLGPAATIFAWLGPVNLVLGLFNLVPAFPLDGGRVLRAIVWWISGDEMRGTTVASALGRAFAWTLIIGGGLMAIGIELPHVGDGLFSGLWLIFVGFFLRRAASTTMEELVVEHVLRDIPVSALMVRPPEVVCADLPLSRLVEEGFIGRGQRCFPVTENRRMIGLVCMEDLRRSDRKAWGRATVRDVMTPRHQLRVAHPWMSASDALAILNLAQVGQLPVVDRGRIVGVVRRRDFVGWFERQAERRSAWVPVPEPAAG